MPEIGRCEHDVRQEATAFVVAVAVSADLLPTVAAAVVVNCADLWKTKSFLDRK